jgi:DNA-binding transcriptional LysR family regulator
MNRANWDDLRFVLAVAETGSVSEAARSLQVTHATVLRRVAAFEERHGAPVFLRGARGYTVLPDKLAVLEAAHQVEAAILAVDRLLTGSASAVKGPVRITSTDSLCQTVLAGLTHEIARGYPDLRLTLHSTNQALDLSRMGADITVRPAKALDDSLIGARAGLLRIVPYRAKGTAAQTWLSLEGALGRTVAAEWMAQSLRKSQIGMGSDSFMALQALVAAGAGQSFLPTILAEADTRLERADWPGAAFTVPVWVACAPEFAHTPKIQVVSELLIARLTGLLV